MPDHLPEVEEGVLVRPREPAAPALEAERDHVAEGEEHHRQLLLVDRGVVPAPLVPHGPAVPVLLQVVALIGRPVRLRAALVVRLGRPVGQLVGVLEHEADRRVQEAHLPGGQEAASPQEPLAALLRLLLHAGREARGGLASRARELAPVRARPGALGVDVLEHVEVELGGVVPEHVESVLVQDVVREEHRLVDALVDVLSVLELRRRVKGRDPLLAEVARGQAQGVQRRHAGERVVVPQPAGRAELSLVEPLRGGRGLEVPEGLGRVLAELLPQHGLLRQDEGGRVHEEIHELEQLVLLESPPRSTWPQPRGRRRWGGPSGRRPGGRPRREVRPSTVSWP